MQLCYRGNTYYPSRDCETSLKHRFNQVDSITTGKFRGNSYTINSSRTNLTAEPTLYQYRGINYIKPTFYGKK